MELARRTSREGRRPSPEHTGVLESPDKRTRGAYHVRTTSVIYTYLSTNIAVLTLAAHRVVSFEDPVAVCARE